MFKILLCALLSPLLIAIARKKRLGFDPTALVLAVLLAVFQAVGHSFEHHGTFRALFDVPSETAYALIGMAAYTVCLYFGIALAFAALDRIGPKALDRIRSNAPVGFLPAGAVAGILLLAWLPYLIVFAPGSFTYDGTFQMDMWHGFAAPSDHHPWIMTAFMGMVFDAGRALGSDNLGVALWVGLQSVVQAFALAASIASMRRMGAPKPALAAALAFFAIAPAWGAYAQAFLKDTLFASLFCLYVTLLVELWLGARRDGRIGWKPYALVAAAGLALCLARHNGSFVVMLTLPFVVFALPRETRLKAVASCLAPLVICFAVTDLAYPAMGVAPAGKQETLGALFQQTARFVKEAPDDVTEGEKAAIGAVLDYEALPELYYGSRSDNVKATYTGNDKALGAYLKAWAAMGLRHPGIYLDAFLNGCYGYFYADESWTHNTWDYRLYNYGPIPGIEDDFEVSYLFDDDVRGVLIEACNRWQNTPLLGLTGHCGLYTWLLLFAAGYLVHARRPKLAFALVPSIVLLLICCVSPVNGYLRYMLPIMAALPLQMWFVCAGAAIDSASDEKRLRAETVGAERSPRARKCNTPPHAPSAAMRRATRRQR